MYYLYGIKNCDTVKKAIKKLELLKIDYEFCDFKKGVLNASILKSWKKQVGDWPVNPKGRIFKQLKDEYEAASNFEKMELILENTSLIKRPVLISEDKILCLGFDEQVYDELK